MKREDKISFRYIYKALLSLLKEVYKSTYPVKMELEPLDKIILRILHTNGCKVLDSSKVGCITYSLESLDLDIILIFGMEGNEINPAYDYIELDFGITKHIIIFADKLVGLFNEEPNELFGRSNYIDILVKIIELMLSVTTSFSILDNVKEYQGLAASNNYRFMPMIIAYAIIDKLFGLEERDVTMVEYKDMRRMLDECSLDNLLCGIRKL